MSAMDNLLRMLRCAENGGHEFRVMRTLTTVTEYVAPRLETIGPIGDTETVIVVDPDMIDHQEDKLSMTATCSRCNYVSSLAIKKEG